jgi:hypothetical protein
MSSCEERDATGRVQVGLLLRGGLAEKASETLPRTDVLSRSSTRRLCRGLFMFWKALAAAFTVSASRLGVQAAWCTSSLVYKQLGVQAKPVNQASIKLQSNQHVSVSGSLGRQ